MLGTLAFALLAAPAPRPSPTPRPVPVLELGVKGPDGKPVAEARVLVVERGSRERPREGRSDALGLARLSVARDVPLDVRVEARGLAPATLEGVRPGPLQVGLTRGATLEGSVRDGSGRPVGDALVAAREMRGGPLLDPALPLVETRSDRDGRFRLEGLPRGALRVSASARGQGRAERADIRAGARVDLVLGGGAWLSGRVTDGSARPVAGARVRTWTASWPGGPPPAVSTDADGRYDLSGLVSGGHDVLASAPGLAPSLARVEVPRQAGAVLDVVLEKGAVVSGRAVDSEGRAVAARVELAELGGRADRSLADLVRTESDAQGRFRLERLPAGSHALLLRARGRGAQRVPVDVGPGETAVDLGEVTLSDGLTLRGRVHDAAGSPIAEARVTSVRLVSGPFEELETRSAPDGAFSFTGLLAGPHRVSAHASGFATVSRTVAAGNDDVDFTLAPGGTLEGQVVDEADRPVESFRVSATGTARGNEGRGTPSGPDGRFRLEDLAVDTYLLEVTAPDRAPALLSNVAVVAGRSRDVGKIRLGPGLSVRGTVVDAGGVGQAGALVQAVEANGEPQPWNAPGGPSGVGGGFEIQGLQAGTYDLIASHPDFVAGRVQSIDVAAGRPAPDVRVTLARGGRVEGRAHRRGAPVAGATVQVIPAGDQVFDWLRRTVSSTGPDGTFRVDRVPAGPARVELIQDGARVLRVEADVVEGETTSVELALRDVLVHGRVTRGGEPATGLSLRLMAPDSMSRPADGPGGAPIYLAAVTDGDGNYRLLVPRPGTYRAVFGTLDSPLGESRTVEIADATEATLDVDLATAAISGQVVDRATGRGLPEARLWARPVPAAPGRAASARSGPDGAFTLRVSPGTYQVSVSTDDHAPWQGDLEAPAAELRIELDAGGVLEGRVVDAGGRGVGSTEIAATPAQGPGAWTTSRADGTFRFSDLSATPYALAAATADGRLAVASGASPGDAPVTLALRPGGRVRLRVLDPDGNPIALAYAEVVGLGGVPLELPYLPGQRASDANGWLLLTAPAGPVQIEVSARDRETATLSVQVAEGVEVEAEARLAPRPAPR